MATPAGTSVSSGSRGPGRIPSPSASAGGGEGEQVDGAGQEKQDRGALGDVTGGDASLAQQPCAHRDAAGAAERHRRAEGHLGQRDRAPKTIGARSKTVRKIRT